MVKKQTNIKKIDAIGQWEDLLEFFILEKDKVILDFIKNERAQGKSILPRQEQIFNALIYCSWDAIKVVILGQDPYPNKQHAHGLAFSIPSNCSDIPKSLKNILKELESDLDIKKQDGNLSEWAKQGVLLLNTTLTVEEGKANSHQRIGWKQLTSEIIQKINDQKENIVFILWGKNAEKLGKNIDEKRHEVIISPHPSPLSSYRGFFDSKPFSRTNDFLRTKNIEEINWSL